MLITKTLTWFKIDPKQPRKNFTESELLSLGESMKSLGQLQPVGAKPDGTLLWGERRYRAAHLVGLKELLAIITERLLSDTEVRLIQLTENMHRADLSGYEKWLACAELMMMNPEWQMKSLSEHLNIDASMVTRLLSPSKCIEPVQEALRDGKIGISDCYALSKCSTPEEQIRLLAQKLSGASRDTIEQAGRKKRAAEAPSVKLSRIRAVLPSGVCIVASGEGLSLDDLIESLGEAQREAKKARDQGLDAKTFSSVMRDKAKKGQP